VVVAGGKRGAQRERVFQRTTGTIDQIEENPNTGNHLYLHVLLLFFCLFGGRGWGGSV
jgi:hypothetical protein